MGEALYRKYRPTTLGDVVGQTHITTTIKNALNSNKISHGYLLSGPRGVGKTSIARIIAHDVNKIPRSSQNNHIDIIEIDAASNRRIDEIRDLRDKVNIAPSLAPYKVYIIDEVHMLTREAFNALLKTLEEPPNHAIFILATTESHKLPATIISRTQHFSFRPIETEDITKHLIKIAKKEKLDLDTSAATMIAQAGEGGLRDSISLLDQLSNSNKITSETVRQLIGTPPDNFIDDLLQHLYDCELVHIQSLIATAKADGLQPEQISSYLIKTIKQRIIQGNDKSMTLIELSKKLLHVKASPQPYDELELLLLEFALSQEKDTSTKSVATATKPAKTITAEKNQVNNNKTKTSQSNPEAEIDKEVDTTTHDIWQQALHVLRQSHSTLYGVGRMATASYNNDTVTLNVPYAFHKARLAESKNLQVLTETISKIKGESVDIVITVKEKGTAQPDLQPKPANKAHDVVSSIFGGGEVLET